MGRGWHSSTVRITLIIIMACNALPLPIFLCNQGINTLQNVDILLIWYQCDTGLHTGHVGVLLLPLKVIIFMGSFPNMCISY